MQRLMIADDSAVIRKVGKRILSGLDFQVSEAASGREALYMCEIQLPDVLIVDESMDGALDLIANVRAMEHGTSVKIYFCVIEADLKRMMLGKRAGADDFLLKPFDRAVLTRVFGKHAVAA